MRPPLAEYNGRKSVNTPEKWKFDQFARYDYKKQLIFQKKAPQRALKFQLNCLVFCHPQKVAPVVQQIRQYFNC